MGEGFAGADRPATFRVAVAVSVAFLLSATVARAEVVPLTGDLMEDVKIEQRLGAQVPLDLEFRDSEGRRVTLEDCLDGRPVILNLAYFRCPRLCRMTADGLIRTLRTMPFSAGEEFDVLTVSFDPTEGPHAARKTRRTVLLRYDRPGAERGWRFLTGEAEPIDELTEAVGFRVAYDEDLDRYAHAAGIVFLTPEGRVSRYLNGVEFPARDVRLALFEASNEKIGSPTDQVLLFCYQYNPKIGKYSLAVTRLLQVFGLGTVAVMAGGIVLMLRRDRANRAAHADLLDETGAEGSRSDGG